MPINMRYSMGYSIGYNIPYSIRNSVRSLRIPLNDIRIVYVKVS